MGVSHLLKFGESSMHRQIFASVGGLFSCSQVGAGIRRGSSPEFACRYPVPFAGFPTMSHRRKTQPPDSSRCLEQFHRFYRRNAAALSPAAIVGMDFSLYGRATRGFAAIRRVLTTMRNRPVRSYVRSTIILKLLWRYWRLTFRCLRNADFKDSVSQTDGRLRLNTQSGVGPAWLLRPRRHNPVRPRVGDRLAQVLMLIR